MQKCKSRITVFFDDPFWVGVYERAANGKLEVCKITFGAEPRDQEVYEYLLQSWSALPFGSPVAAATARERKASPKRRQREIKRQLDSRGVGTRAQQALKQQQAEGKAARKRKTRLERELEKERQFALRQSKRKQKHMGH